MSLPPQKQAPTNALPFTSITTWISTIQPGTPSPESPHRRASVVSITATATPMTGDMKVPDFASVGYASIFVHLPHTPLPQPAKKQPTRFRSLSLSKLTFRSRSNLPKIPVPPLPKHPTLTLSTKPPKTPKTPRTPSSKKSQYAKHKPKHAHPAPIANELLLMQLLDGGSIDHQATRLMREHSTSQGVSTVHRDDKGGIWYDRDEELEYAPLIPSSPTSPSWEHFNLGSGDDDMDFACSGDNTSSINRRESAASTDSDLDPKYQIKHAEADGSFGLPLPTPLFPAATEALLKRTEAKAQRTATTKSGKSILTVPARARRTTTQTIQVATHLNKPTYLVDINIAFDLPLSPNPSPSSPRSPTPKSPRFPQFYATHSPSAVMYSPSKSKKPRGAARRRPAPLTLSSSSSSSTSTSTSTSSHLSTTTTTSHEPNHKIQELNLGGAPIQIDTLKARQEFLETSFEPTVAPAPPAMQTLAQAVAGGVSRKKLLGF